MASVKSGLDVLVDEGFSRLHGAKLGIIANPGSINCELQHIIDLCIESGACEVVRLFAPEHGLRGVYQDMEKVSSAVDPRTNLPVHSLYGDSKGSLTPTSESLEGIDTLLFDLPDIGSRYYTYAQTLAYTMVAAAEADIKVVVVDRPNPLSGAEIEGPNLRAESRSFCGLYNTPPRHGLTIGEYAKMVTLGFGEGDYAVEAVDCELDVVEMQGWKREMYFDETGLPWVIPSPNMPTLDTAIVYPGGCLFEGTNLSEGRGTTRPFEFLGAPFLNSEAWIQETHDLGVELTGAVLRSITFIPKFQKWADKYCQGVQIHVTDRATFKPFRWGLALIAAAAKLHPDEFSWRHQVYEFEKDSAAIDLLYGDSAFRRAVETRKGLSQPLSEIEQFENEYRSAREPLLLY